jgi:nicotinate-nucleotide pyrophosphorylase (carboxylating)
MTKEELIEKYFQRKKQLTTENKMYSDHLSELFQWIIKADTITQDATSHNLELIGMGTAHIVTKQEGIVAGMEEIIYLIKKHTKLIAQQRVKDGAVVSHNEIILSLSGNNVELLSFERAFVNILGRMSGIATNCRGAIDCLSTKFPTMIAATRKTPWMFLDKKAVAVGGGLTHRLHLSDWPMIKDNHIKILEMQHLTSLEEIIKQMIRANIDFFEIEVETIEQAEIVMKTFKNQNKRKNAAMAILLDNFNYRDATYCISMLSHYENIIFEASGNITKENLSEWANTGIDILSLGELTHSAHNFDFSMRFI